MKLLVGQSIHYMSSVRRESLAAIMKENYIRSTEGINLKFKVA